MTTSALYNYHHEPLSPAAGRFSPRGSTTSSMESESPPAGYFSTFSIVDPKAGGAAGGGGSSGGTRSQKRNRRVFVCIPCHKRKLKCDKNLPCGRCVAYGAPDECVYQPLPTTSSSPSSSAGALGRPEPSSDPPSSSRASSQVGIRDRYRYQYRPGDGKCRATGVTHWATVCAEFDEACPYLFGLDPQWEPRFRQLKNLKYLFPSLAGANFPFSINSPYIPSKHDILNSLPPRGVADALLGNYMSTFEGTHRLLHPAQFERELEAFWADRESVLDGWLAQLCTMMALGCQSAPDGLFDGTGHSTAQWTDVLLDGAQISLCRSPYMLMPSLTTIRTLCMMAMCKMVGLRGTSSQQVATLMGFVVRLAMSLQLHRTSTLFHGMPEFDAEMRRRVWATVQLLDLDVAMWAGTAPICRETDAEPPLNISDSDIRPDPAAAGVGVPTGPHGVCAAPSGWVVESAWATHEYTDGTFQSKLAELLPLLGDVVSAANSSSMMAPSRPVGTGASGNASQAMTDPDKVLRLDKRLRLRLKEAEALLASGRGTVRPERVSTLAAQHQFLRVLVHRALMALHHTLARGPHPGRHEQSVRALLESALALLNIQQQWAADEAPAPALTSGSTLQLPAMTGRGGGGGGPASAASSPGLPPTVLGGMAGGSLQWLLDLCHDDFSISAAYVVLGLRRGDFDEWPQDSGPSADLAAAAVRQSLAVARSRACRSLLQFKEFTGLSVLVGCLRCVRGDAGGTGGDPNAMLATLMEVAHDVEDVIVTGKSDMIWSSASAAAGGAMGMVQVHDLPHHAVSLSQQQQQQPEDAFDSVMGVQFLGSFP